MLKAPDRHPGLDQGLDLFGMAGVQTEAVPDGTPRWHLVKMSYSSCYSVSHNGN